MINFGFQNRTSVQITNNETKYKLEEITGLNGFENNINLLELAGQDGSVYNSSKIPSREIVATISVIGNVEENRLKLIKALMGDNYCLLFFQTDTRHVYIEGYPKTADVNAFKDRETGQIAFTCPNPFFHKHNNTDTSISAGSSQTNVANDGDVSVGFEATISLTSISGNPTQLLIERIDSNGTKKIIINYADGFESGDVIKIKNSFQNNKKIVTLIRSGQNINLISAVNRINTEWFVLSPGYNYMRFKVGDSYSYEGTYTCTITHREDYVAI